MPQPSLVALWSTLVLGNLSTFTGKEGEIRFSGCFSAVKISLCLPESAHFHCQAGVCDSWLTRGLPFQAPWRLRKGEDTL